jgi:nicotinamidase-related amidase
MSDQLSIDKGKTAILIMDYQNRQLGYFSESFQSELLAKANRVLDKARLEGIPVIYIEVVRGERTPEREIHPDIMPQPGEPVLTKSRTGPFSTTNLDEVLKKQEIDTLALMGISTSGCVLSTVRWAADINYQLMVISDCCADRDDEVHRVLMEKVFPRQASVVTAQEFIRAAGDA